MKTTGIASIILMSLVGSSMGQLPYPIVDTGQDRCYNATREITYPDSRAAFFGQDAQVQGLAPSYRDNGDGTVSDRVTGLMWQQDPGKKKTYSQAVAGARTCRAGGYTDWRLPTLKELYSLIQFNGDDPSATIREDGTQKPFIDNTVFAFQYGKESDGDRIIDSQFATSTQYVSTTMGGKETMFGVNFADGRIKGYPTGKAGPKGTKKFYVLYVRGNPAYGNNDFKASRNGTISDASTGLMWQQGDSGNGMNWQEALAYAENLTRGGYDDWRLPSAKELQSIVDYSRSPDTTRSAAIDPLFSVTSIRNEAGQKDYASYWTGTTHQRGTGQGVAAVTIAFGRAMGYMRGRWMDVHGAGAQRSDPKAGDSSRYSQGRGPQGDAIRIDNFVRCVRGGTVEPRTSGPAVQDPVGRSRSESPNGPSGGFVSHLDRNGDGHVSRQEFDGSGQHFSRLDKNRDGVLDETEAPSGPPSGQKRSGRPARH
jgi:Protein of unknown function (DUF1566)/EF hand